MVLQYAFKYHEARDWICLQDQSTLTYQSLLAHIASNLKPGVSNSNKTKAMAEVTSPPLQLPHPVTPPYMLTPSPQLHASHVPDAVIPTLMAPAQPLTTNAITVTPLGTSQPCAGDPAPTGIQSIPPTRGQSPKADNAGPTTTDIQAGHIA